MTTVYFAGGEDIDFALSGPANVSTTAGFFRSTLARCAIFTQSGGFLQNTNPFTATTFWFSARGYTNTSSPSSGVAPLALLDASGLVRIRILNSTGFQPSTYIVQSLTTAGVATNLFSFSTSITVSGSDKWDIYLSYVNSGAGFIQVYLNNNLMGSYSGNITSSDGTTTLSYVRMTSFYNSTALGTAWSEVMVLDQDTRTMSLLTLPPVANGNTHNFDTGTPAAANVNEITLNDATLDGSTTAGQIDEYTIGTLSTGTYTIVAFGISARAAKGSSGPTKMTLTVRQSSTDYQSSNQVLTTGWANYNNFWVTDPSTSATWASLPANIGVTSVA